MIYLLWFLAGVIATVAAFYQFGGLLLREVGFAIERRAVIRWLKTGARKWPYSVNASVAYDIARGLENRAHLDEVPKSPTEQTLNDMIDEAVREMGNRDK